SMIEPGPACAADEIHRIPTMHVMAKSVTSRKPSSRRSFESGSGTNGGLLYGLLLEFHADTPQSFLEELRFPAEPYADEAFEPEMHARNDQHALVHADAIA